MTTADSEVGVVVIGRNEGRRLLECLTSLGDLASHAVYVDSGSTDGSQASAAALGVTVVELDGQLPFTAARARNAGYSVLIQHNPDLEYVQFIDGDCLLDTGWIGVAKQLMEREREIALVCGRRRERYPEHSIYNAMCDREWDGPVGSILESGGDFLVRTVCFAAVGGFRDSLIAGEEPELCLRLREGGWKIWRLRREMTLHDANILRFSQWWKRAVRTGHAYAEVSALHRNSTKRIWRRNAVRALGWASVAPLALIGTLVSPWALAMLFAYPAGIVRQAFRSGPSRGANWRDAVFASLGKFAEAQGIMKYHFHRALDRRTALIEYK